ncbi:VanZ family protein [Maricaulis sp.]|uniref:VanZ family protein n=1 Tax=Maricaulis sp. TaxID=1486257 RepID=UPI0025BFB9B3|nr:VanZ family protein [Maricaulis sp.]
MTLRWAARILFVVAIVLITDLALQPGSALPPRLFGSDKVEHFGAFLVLAVLARIAWPELPRWVGLLILVGYGGAIEWLQGQGDAGRTASLADLVADTIGVLAGLGLARLAGRNPRH